MLTRIITGFVALWFILYLFAYFLFMSPSKVDSVASVLTSKRGLRLSDTPFAKEEHQQQQAGVPVVKDKSGTESGDAIRSIAIPSMLTNPFVSDVCIHALDDSTNGFSPIAPHSVAVVIPTRNEDRASLLHTVSSVIANSGAALRRIVIVDDLSDVPISSWPDWSQKELSSLVRVVRSSHRAGVAGAKALGAQSVASEVDLLVFLDAHVVVSDLWLLPLASLLDKHPHSIVYPAIDVIDPSSGDLIKSENVLGGFSWSLSFRWEALAQSRDRSRLPTASQNAGPDDVVTSPAAPGILAMKSYYYTEMGGFDLSLGPWGQDSIELSIRTWLCGGAVIRQPCSRVAHRYDNLFGATVASRGNGVTQARVDLNVMTVAEHWMLPSHRSTVFQARFTGRVPYSVEVGLDSRQPKHFNTVKMLAGEQCQLFDWYLAEVYPGLVAEASEVEAKYYAHLHSNYLEAALAPTVRQYQSGGGAGGGLLSGLGDMLGFSGDPPEIAKIVKRANSPDERATQLQHDSLIPKPYYLPGKNKNMHFAGLGSAIDIAKSEETDPHERHANYVRETLNCEDEQLPQPSQATCAKLAAKNDGCMNNRYYMMFGCPKTCGLCGIDGKICMDFFEIKCPQYKAEGKCEEDYEQMKHDCRKSCGHCVPAAAVAPAAAAPAVPVVPVVPVPVVPLQQLGQGQGQVPPALVAGAAPVAPAAAVQAKGAAAAPVQPLEPPAPLVAPLVPPISASAPQAQAAAATSSLSLVDPYVAQKQYAAGLLSDPQENACDLNGKPHGQLLQRISVSPNPPASDVRILCSIYTMEKNHATNVQATKESWAKRCDGFVAFSTVSDASIPAMKIEHEGEESYDNMWQKSRSIWKFIGAHLADKFDFFLLGGDDMFYIVENLRAYLGSAEVRQLRDKGEGVFIGRRFFPPNQAVFNSGGAGYLLDRKALDILSANLDAPACFPHQHGFWEDVNVAHCLSTSGNIVPHDTRDSQERERFHPFTPGQHLTYRIPKLNPDWYPKYNPFLKEGFECCSSESVSFHYVPAPLMRQLHSYLYHCEQKTQ